jgi:hypothetical protein
MLFKLINIVIFLYIHDTAFSSIFDHFHDLFHRPVRIGDHCLVCAGQKLISLLNLMFLMCSLYLVVKVWPVCLIYTLRQLWKVILHMPLCSYVFNVCVLLNSLPTVMAVLNATFKLVSLNNFVILHT